jgi:hypothetical protein
MKEQEKKIKNLEEKLTKKDKEHKAGLAELKDALEQKYLAQLNEDLARQKKTYETQLAEKEKTIEQYKVRGVRNREALEKAIREKEASRPPRAEPEKAKRRGRPAKAGGKKEENVSELDWL